MCAMSGTSGSSGFGSHSKEHMDNKTARKKEEKIRIHAGFNNIINVFQLLISFSITQYKYKWPTFDLIHLFFKISLVTFHF